MSVVISTPTPSGMAKAKYFMFNARYRDFVGGRVIQDTSISSASVAAGRATVKSYSFTTGANATTMRIRVYGYLNVTTVATVYINLNGTDVYSATINNNTEQLIIDIFININASTYYAMRIDFYNTSTISYTLYITKVYVFIGYPLTSTAETTIASIARSTDLQIAVSYINVKYEVGVRYYIVYHRKTTATATLRVGATTLTIVSADDRDTYQITRSTMPVADAVTVSGYVGASGDIIIITNLFVLYVLRGNQADSKNVFNSWCVVVQEAGYIIAIVRYVTLDGLSRSMNVYNITLNGTELAYSSALGSNVMFTFEGASMGEMAFYVDGVEDSNSYSAIVSLALVVISS